MDYYRIKKNNWSIIQKCKTKEDAEEICSTLGEGYKLEYIKPYLKPTLQERLTMDLDFGSRLIYTFAEDNRIKKISIKESEQLLNKFRDIITLAQLGSIEDIDYFLPFIKVDNVFTEKRKKKYIKMIKKYLRNF